VPSAGITETGFSVTELEEKLEAALSKIDGAGKVKVILTVRSSTEQILAEDRESSQRIRRRARRRRNRSGRSSQTAETMSPPSP
jgi:stage III sporulation protein AG